MKKRVRLQVMLLLLIAGVFIGACSSGSEANSSPPATATKSEEEEYLIGRWQVNDGRFGHKIFDFHEDGRLLIEDVDSGEMIEMSYVFVGENSLVLSGYDAFNGSATVNFYENKLDMTVNFEGTIFGELYVFTREDAAE
ncbi:MAG: hypothetical protein KC449_09200 [Anaerolineales bacterium]|nr:hypothetical protein [Anaerolineales bacterium]